MQPREPLAPDGGCGRGCGRPAGFAFTHAFQPIVDLESGMVFAYEAFLRGPGGEGAQAVLAGVTEADRCAFDRESRAHAIRTARRLRHVERLSINFLPDATDRPGACLRSTVIALRQHGFQAESVVLEAAGGERLRDVSRLAAILSEARTLGFLTAVDDFGGRYANLDLLTSVRPHLVKLDIALVRGIDGHRPRQSIVSSIASLCAALDITVAASGVETIAERDFLYALGVRLMQGRLFARPEVGRLPAVAGHAWIAAAFSA